LKPCIGGDGVPGAIARAGTGMPGKAGDLSEIAPLGWFFNQR